MDHFKPNPPRHPKTHNEFLLSLVKGRIHPKSAPIHHDLNSIKTVEGSRQRLQPGEGEAELGGPVFNSGVLLEERIELLHGPEHVGVDAEFLGALDVLRMR